MSPEGFPPTGRFARFRKFVSASTVLGADALSRSVKRLWSQEEPIISVASAEKWVSVLGDMKGLAMKLGQVASMDVDLLPPEVRAVLSKLQNQAPSMSFQAVESVFSEEFRSSPSKMFAEFSPAPVAAASLGQGHRARLFDGREVAVKVQYPGMAEALSSDFDNVKMWVSALSATSRHLDGKEYYEEFREQVVGELDYVAEAQRAIAFANAVRPFADLKVPEVYAELSSRRILTMEWLEGDVLTEVLKRSPFEPSTRYDLTRLLIRAVYGPLVAAGQMHVDPHPGNFMMLPDGKLGVLDFGSVKTFSDPFVAAQKEMFQSSIEGTPLNVLEVFGRMGFESELSDDTLQPLLEDMWKTIGAATASPEYDFASDDTLKWAKQFAKQHAWTLLKVRPPKEAVMFFRATSGLQQNLRLLAARGNIQAIYREIGADVAREGTLRK